MKPPFAYDGALFAILRIAYMRYSGVGLASAIADICLCYLDRRAWLFVDHRPPRHTQPGVLALTQA